MLAAFAQDAETGDWAYAGSASEPYAMVAAPLLWDDNLTVFKPARGSALVQSVVIPLATLAHDQPIPCHTGHGFGHGDAHVGGWP